MNAKEIGMRIKELRKAHGLTQAQLADQAGTTQNHLGKIEVGMKMPSLELFVELAGCLETTLDYLVLGKINNDILNCNT